MTDTPHFSFQPLDADRVLMELVEELTALLPEGTGAVERFLREHPDHAEPLRQFLPTLQAVVGLGARSSPDVPKVLGDYEIIRTIGQGGMGTVYEAVQRSLGRHVALKVLLNRGSLSASSQARFVREAQAAAKLHHTNIVPVFGIGEQDGLPFYAMQFIRGEGLDRVLDSVREIFGSALSGTGSATHLSSLRQGDTGNSSAITNSRAATAPDPGEATSPPASALSLVGAAAARDRLAYQRAVARLGVQVAQGLAYAHGLGILHRDVKPSNLLLDERGTAWIADFGLATYVDGSEDLTGTGEVVGTLRYMAPERFRGSGDVRSDIYSLGLTLYEMLTLRSAFEATERPRLMEQVLNAAPPRPRRLDRSLPADLETIVLKAIDRVPAGRYASAGELADDLDRFLQDQPIKARRYSWREQVWRWCKRRPAQAAAVGAGLLALVTLIVAVVLIAQSREQEAQARQAEHAVAVENAQLAQEQGRLLEEERKLRHAERRNNAQLFFDRVYLRLTSEDAALGLHNLALSLARATEAQMPELERAIRIQLTTWSEHVPAVRASFSVRRSTKDSSGGLINTTLPTNRLSCLSSRDGKVLVTWNRFDGVHRWDLETGQPLGPPLSFRHNVTALSLSHDGKQLFIATASGLGSLHETASGKVLGSLPPRPNLEPKSPSNPIVVFSKFSADGQRLLLSDEQGSVELRQLPGFALLSKMSRFQQRITTLELLPSGDRAVIGCLDGSVAVWDLLHGQQVVQARSSIAQPGIVTMNAISPDGKRVLTGFASGSLLLWEAETGKVLLSSPATPLGSVWVGVFSLDGKRVWSGSENGEVRVIELEPAVRGPFRIGRHGGAIVSMSVTSDGERLLTASSDHTAQVWDVNNSARLLGAAMAEDSAVILACLLQGERRVATLSDAGHVRIWEAPGLRETEPDKTALPLDSPVGTLCYSPDGRWLGACDRGRKVSLWSLSTKQRVGTATISDPLPPSAIAFRPDGKTVAVSCEGAIHILELPTGKLATAIACPRRGRIELSSDGGLTFAIPFNLGFSRCQVYALEQQAVLRKTIDFPEGLTAGRFSPDGKLLLAAGGDFMVRAYDLGSGQPVSPPLKHHSRVGIVMGSADNATLLTATTDSQATLWHTQTGRRLHQVGIPGGLLSAALSPDGKHVMLATGSSTVELWDVGTGKRIGPSLSLPTNVNVLACRADGRQFAAATPRGVHLLDLPEPMLGSPEELALRMQVLTGTELGAAGELRVLDPAVWQERRRQEAAR